MTAMQSHHRPKNPRKAAGCIFKCIRPKWQGRVYTFMKLALRIYSLRKGRTDLLEQKSPDFCKARFNNKAHKVTSKITIYHGYLSICNFWNTKTDLQQWRDMSFAEHVAPPARGGETFWRGRAASPKNSSRTCKPKGKRAHACLYTGWKERR